MFRVLCMSAAAVASGLHISPEPTLLVGPSNLASRLGAESRLGSGIVRAAASGCCDACAFMEDDVAHNLDAYALLFATGKESRTKIAIIGDSLLDQFYGTIKCAAEILRMHTEDIELPTVVKGAKEFGTVIKHSANATGGVEIHMRKIWKFRKIPDPQSCSVGHLNEIHGGLQWHCDISWAGFCSWTEGYDHVFANLAHHELRDKNETDMSFEQIVNTVFKETQQCALRNHVHWVGHPPSHFNSPDGGWNDQGNEHDNHVFSQHCTCDLPRARLQEQAIIRNSQLAEQLAHQYGVSYISIWQEFIMKCDKHPHDCLHYTMSPANFMPLMKKILQNL